MKKSRKINWYTPALLLGMVVLLASCGSDDLMESADYPSGQPLVFDLNWDAHGNGPYLEETAIKDFKTLSNWNNRMSIEGQAMTVTLLQDKLSGDGGIVARTSIPANDEYKLSFDVMFPEDFEWGRGGKVGYGLLMGDGNTGCDKADDGKGASARMMWYQDDDGRVTFKPYLYYNDMPEDCGDNLVSSAVFPATGSLEKGKWYSIGIQVKSNTGSNTDGHVTYSVDGNVILDEAIRWTTDESKRFIDQLTFSTFRGGSQEHWMVDRDTQLKIDNLRVESVGNPGQPGSTEGGIMYPFASMTTIFVGQSVDFKDYSTRVESRQWTFEGGSIGTSSQNEVTVTYSQPGEFAATLDLIFTDGSKGSETFLITVNEEHVPLVSVEGPTYVFYSEDPDLPQDHPKFNLQDSGLGLAQFSASAFEGNESMNLSIDPSASSTFAMLQTEKVGTADLTQFINGYLNIALKSTSQDPVHVRIEGGGANSYAKVNAGDYGFERDGNWHFISIPMQDVLSRIDTEAGQLALLGSFDQFRLRNQTGEFDSSTFDFSADFIFFSNELPVLAGN